MLGRRVKWKNSFREFEGTVVEVHGEKCTIFEFTDLEEYCVVQQQLTLWQPDCSRYASYLRKKLDNPSFETGKNLTIHDLVISVLESLSGDQTFQRSKKDAIEHEMRLKSAAARVNLNSESDEKFACMFYSKLSPQSKAVQAAHCKDAMAPERSPNKTVQKEEADSDEHSSDESGSDDPDGSDNDNDSSDSESDNSSEDEDEDEDDTSDSEEQESEDDDEKIDIKIYVLPNDDVRGFSVRLSDAGLKTMQKALKKDYSAFPHIFFRDSDGDALAVKSAHDLRYAYRATKSQLSTGEVIKLKLFAEVGDVAAAAPAKWRLQQHRRGAPTGLTTSSNISVDSLSPTVHFADKISMTNGEVGISGLHALTASSKEGGGGSGAHSPARAALNFEVLWKRGELLGSGSFGKVFSGINLATGERMAVKEVALRRSKKHKQQVQALQLEVKILSSLDHPNIIKYFGTEFTKHTLRIFLELANDGTVKDALNEFGAFPEPLVRRYAADILEGLWFLHSHKFIHRDIKPTNLLVSGGRVKLGDFGCSTTILEEESTFGGGDGHSTIAGTALYMAPEVMQAGGDIDVNAVASQQQQQHQHQIHQQHQPKQQVASGLVVDLALDLASESNNTSDVHIESRNNNNSNRRRKKGYGKRADVWSMGITLCEMATGKAPFTSAGAAIFAVCVSKKFPAFPDVFSPEAHEFLNRCLVEDAKMRATCAELRLMPFMSAQTVEEARAQTAATLPLRTAHTTSHVTVHLLPSDFSFLRSPRADATEDDADCLGAAAAHGTGRGRGREIGRERGGEYRDHKIAGGGGTEGAKEGEGRGGGDSFLDDHGHQRDLFQSSFRSGDFDHDHDQDLATGRGRDRFYDYDYATSAAAVSCSVGTDMFRTAASEVLGHRYLSARSVSQDEETFKRGNDRHLVNDHLKCSSNAQEKSADAFQSSYMTAKECEEDEDCKTGRSTTFSERANFRRHY